GLVANIQPDAVLLAGCDLPGYIAVVDRRQLGAQRFTIAAARLGRISGARVCDHGDDVLVDDAAIDDGSRYRVAALEPARDRRSLGFPQLQHGIFLAVG